MGLGWSAWPDGLEVEEEEEKEKKKRLTCGSSGIFRIMFFYSFSLRVLICAGTFSSRKHESDGLNSCFTVCIFTDSARDALTGVGCFTCQSFHAAASKQVDGAAFADPKYPRPCRAKQRSVHRAATAHGA
jgi:hypothetical protein